MEIYIYDSEKSEKQPVWNPFYNLQIEIFHLFSLYKLFYLYFMWRQKLFIKKKQQHIFAKLYTLFS